MAYLNSEEYRRFYHAANPCSLATFLFLVMWAMALVIPFFLTFKTHEFGLRQPTVSETPNIIFQDAFVMYNYENNQTLAYSSVASFNELIDNKVSSPSIKSFAIDSDYDNKADKFKFQISFASDTTTLQKTQIYLFFSYELTKQIHFKMQDFIKLEIIAPRGYERAQIAGKIELDQKTSFSSHTISNTYYTKSLFNDPNANYNIVDLENEKIRRNETLYCQCETAILPALGVGTVLIDIDLIAPGKQILYKQHSILEGLKFSWIEYFSVFIPVYLILNRALNYLYKSRIIPVREVNNL